MFEDDKGINKCHQLKKNRHYQSSRWAPILRPKTSKTLFGPVNFSVFISNYIKRQNTSN